MPPELDLGPDDLAWIATDLLALACDDEYPDPDDLAVSFREAVPVGQEVPLFDAMARSAHPDAEDVLDSPRQATTRTSRSPRRPGRPPTKPPPASGPR